MTARAGSTAEKVLASGDATSDAIARRVAELLARAPDVVDEQRSAAVRLLVGSTSPRPATRPAAKAPATRAA